MDALKVAPVLETIFCHLGPNVAPIVRLVHPAWRDESDRIYGLPGTTDEGLYVESSPEMHQLLIDVGCEHFARRFRSVSYWRFKHPAVTYHSIETISPAF